MNQCCNQGRTCPARTGQAQDPQARIAQLEALLKFADERINKMREDHAAQLVAEAARTAEEKLRADQMTQQYAMQAKMHAQASAQLAAVQQGVQQIQANCYSSDDGDYWRDCPDDCDFVEGLKVGDTFELQASVRAWSETFRVTKAPDDSSDDYEIELVSSDAPFATHPAQQGLDAAAALREARKAVMQVRREILNHQRSADLECPSHTAGQLIGVDMARAAIARIESELPTQQGLDAQRWQIVHDHISGEYIAGRACFVVHVQPMSGANIMRGSVAEHFTKAVDDIAAQIKIAAQAKQGEQANGAE